MKFRMGSARCCCVSGCDTEDFVDGFDDHEDINDHIAFYDYLGLGSVISGSEISSAGSGSAFSRRCVETSGWVVNDWIEIDADFSVSSLGAPNQERRFYVQFSHPIPTNAFHHDWVAFITGGISPITRLRVMTNADPALADPFLSEDSVATVSSFNLKCRITKSAASVYDFRHWFDGVEKTPHTRTDFGTVTTSMDWRAVSVLELALVGENVSMQQVRLVKSF